MNHHHHYSLSYKGLGNVTKREIIKRHEVRTDSVSRYFNNKFDILTSPFPKDIDAVMNLHTVEHLFILLDKRPINGTYADLKSFKLQPIRKQLVMEALRNLESITRVHKWGKRFRVISQADDAIWRKYRRIDLQDSVRKMFGNILPDWRGVEDESRVVFGVHQIGKEVLIGLEIPIGHVSRLGMVNEHPDALPYSITNAMVFLSKPHEDDVVLSLLSKDGRKIIERAQFARYKQLFVHTDGASGLELIAENIGPKYKPIELFTAEVSSLPVADNGVDKLLCSLPEPDLEQKQSESEHFVTSLVQECVRVLKPGGRFVLSTYQPKLLKRIMLRNDTLSITEQFKDIWFYKHKIDLLIGEKITRDI